MLSNPCFRLAISDISAYIEVLHHCQYRAVTFILFTLINTRIQESFALLNGLLNWWYLTHLLKLEISGNGQEKRRNDKVARKLAFGIDPLTREQTDKVLSAASTCLLLVSFLPVFSSSQFFTFQFVFPVATRFN